MKKYLLMVLVMILFFSSILSGFVDKGEENREKILKKLDELKYIKGVLLSGRGKIYMDAVKGSGLFFQEATTVKDYNQHIQLDMNILTRPVDIVEAGAEVRFKTDLSTEPYLEEGKNIILRNIFAQFIFFEFIKLRFGSLYEHYTPFTLYAPLDLIPMRSELFFPYYREEQYDHLLYNKDDFPLKGGSMQMEFLIPYFDGILGIKGLAVKIGEGDINLGNSYDRYFFAEHSYLTLNDFFKTSVTWAEIRDLEDTNTTNYNTPVLNDVIAGSWEFDIAPWLFVRDKALIISLGFEGESAVSWHDTDTDSPLVKNIKGFAHSVNFFTGLKNIGKFKAGWRSIDYEFVAPAAQTRMATPAGESKNYINMALPPMLPDYSYRKFIRLSRDYNDILNFTYPMNEATPNRTGFFGELSMDLKYLNLSSQASVMSERRPVGAPNENKRSFVRNANEISFPFPEILDLSVQPRGLVPEISFFNIIERVKREDFNATILSNQNEAEDCKVDVFGMDVVFVPLKVLSLSALYQVYTVKGRKINDVYASHEPLQISGYQHQEFHIKNTIIGFGLQYSFSPVTQFQLDYFIKEYSDVYKMNQLRALFQMTF